MQLMSEPHNRRQHFLEAPAFYSSDSNPAPIYYSPDIATLNTGASPIVQTHPGYTSESSGTASGLQHQQELGFVQFGGDLSVSGTSGLITSEITNQTQAIATETTEAITPDETNSKTSDNIPTFDDESSLASTASYQGEQTTYLGVKQESEQLGGGTSSSRGSVCGTSIASDIGIIIAPPQQSNLRMNIQPSGFTKNHLLNNSPDELSLKKRREDLSRRPSYRKIFNDLTGLSGPLETPPGTNVHMIANVGQLAPPTAPSHRQSPHQPVTSSNQTQAATSSPSPQALDLLSSVGMSTAATTGPQDPSLGASHSPVSVVDLQTTSAANQLAQQQLQQASHQHQHQQQQHQHHHLPPPPIPQSTNHHQQQHVRHHQQQQHHHQHQHQHQQQQHLPQQHQHQPHPQLHHHQQQPLQASQAPHHHPQASQSHQAHHMLNTTTSPPITGEVNKKRELRLQKNREAAKECRRKKKEYIKCLENRVAVLENQNKALIDELKTLKDLYCKSTNE